MGPCNEACDPGLCCGLSLADLLDVQEEFGLHTWLCLGSSQSTGHWVKICFVGFWAHLALKFLVGGRSSFPWGSHGLNQPSPDCTCISWQVKATDGGSPPLSSHVRLHISWVARPGPSSEPLAFDEPHFNFAVMETDPVNHMVGVISIEMGPSQVWFNITGETQKLNQGSSVWERLPQLPWLSALACPSK